MQRQLPLLQKQAAQLSDGIEVNAAFLVSANARTTSCIFYRVPCSACNNVLTGFDVNRFSTHVCLHLPVLPTC